MTIDNETKQAIMDALRQLDDADASVRAEGARELGAIGLAHPQIIERLQSIALDETSADVLRAVGQSLELLQPSQTHNSLQIELAGSQSMELGLTDGEAIIELLQRQNQILEDLVVLIQRSSEARDEERYRLLARVVACPAR